MTDWQILFIVLGAIYLSECIVWVPRGTVALASALGRRYRPSPPFSFIGNDNGGFAPMREFEAGWAPQSVAVGDFDADGHLDIVTTNGDSTLNVLLATDPEEYELAHTFSGGSRPVSVKVADFNEDGVDDFAWAQQLSNRVGIVASDP